MIKNFNVANDSRLIKLYDRAKNVYDCSTLINWSTCFCSTRFVARRDFVAQRDFVARRDFVAWRNFVARRDLVARRDFVARRRNHLDDVYCNVNSISKFDQHETNFFEEFFLIIFFCSSFSFNLCLLNHVIIYIIFRIYIAKRYCSFWFVHEAHLLELSSIQQIWLMLTQRLQIVLIIRFLLLIFFSMTFLFVFSFEKFDCDWVRFEVDFWFLLSRIYSH